MDATIATLRSWTATARLAVAEQRRGATTARYSRQLLDAGEEALSASERALAQRAQTPEDRARAQAAEDSLRRALRDLRAAAGPS